MSRRAPCGPGCVALADLSNASRLSAGERREDGWVVGDRVIRTIASGGHQPDHPFHLEEGDPTLDERSRLLALLREARPEHVLPVSAVCRCSFESPFLEGRPLQDFGLGPGSNRLVHPRERRLLWPPGTLERLLAQLALGLENLHALGVAHGDPALMNAVTEGMSDPRAAWIDLNSVRPASPAARDLDAAAFLYSTVWPALLDAEHHSPSLFQELARIAARGTGALPALREALGRERGDHSREAGRAAFLAALAGQAPGPQEDESPFARTRRRLTEAMAPLYFLDQTRSDQDVRFLTAVLSAERTRAKILEEERTRLHYHRFQGEIDRLTAREKELSAQLAEAEARAAPALPEAREAAGRDPVESAAALVALQGEVDLQLRRLEALHLSTSWRVTAPLRATGRLVQRGIDKLTPRPGNWVWRALRSGYRTIPLRAATKARLVGYLVSRGFLRALPAGGVPIRKRPEVTRPQSAWPEDRPLVTVVIPCFNYGRFVPSAISSVLSQTFQDIEVLVVDGGSTDGESRRLLSEVSWPKTEIFLREGRHLVGDNRNFAIAKARGRYICCLDADDRLQPTFLEKALFLLETQGYDVVSTGIQTFGVKNEVYSVMRYPSLADVAHSNQVATCAVFRRELWEKAGGYVDAGLGADYVYEDWRLWVRFAALGARIANLVEEPLFLYRVHGRSLSRQDEIAPIERQRPIIAEANQDVLTPEAHQVSEIERELRVRMDDPWRNLRSRSGHKPLEGRSPHPTGGPTLLLVVPFLIVGGAERLLSQIAIELHRRGYRLILVSTVYVDESFGDCSDWFAPATSEIYHLPRFIEPELWRDFLFTQIETKKVDLLWVVGSAFLYDLLPEIKQAYPHLKVIDLLFNTVVHARSNRKRSRQIDLTLVENREVRDWLLKHREKAQRIRLVESGVDLETCRPRGGKAGELLAKLGLPDDAFVAGFSGRLSEEKSPEAFLEIARQLSGDPRFYFLMTGAGPLVEEVKRKIARLQLGPRFQFLGRVEDVHEILGLYDALVLPSRFDGRPVVVLESLAMGVPVVASKVGALPDLVREGETGFLCRPGDVQGFVDRLRWLADHPEEHRRMRTAARAHAEAHFDAKRMFDAYAGALGGLVAEDGSARSQ